MSRLAVRTVISSFSVVAFIACGAQTRADAKSESGRPRESDQSGGDQDDHSDELTGAIGRMIANPGTDRERRPPSDQADQR